MRALMATLTPGRGGVAAMRRATVDLLAEREIELVAAWYEGYSIAPELSVPLHRLGTRRPATARRQLAGAAEAWAMGCWLPELEFMHYHARPAWRELMNRCDICAVVSGNCLPGWLMERTRRPYFAWIASDWWGDRKDRVESFAASRRWLDRCFVRPVARRIEQRVLRSGYVLALSQATRRELDRIAGRPVVRGILPVPIDLCRFQPAPEGVARGRLGLAGRFDDPRKNVRLFLAALAEARRLLPELTGVLIGSSVESELAGEIDRLGLRGVVEVAGELSVDAYAARLRTLDVLVVTSHQEGLHVAALEAMACGCPVVSTRCGGPEEFVTHGQNGWLAGFDAGELARRVVQIVEDRDLRTRFSAAARATAVNGYSQESVRAVFFRHFDEFLDHSRESAGTRGRGMRSR